MHCTKEEFYSDNTIPQPKADPPQDFDSVSITINWSKSILWWVFQTRGEITAAITESI